MNRKANIFIPSVFIIIFVLSGCKHSTENIIRIGFFPNLTHSQAVYGYANGEFEKAFGDHYQVKWQSFNAGPAEVEAMFANEVDIGYIGPIPAINGYLKSRGDLKIIAGATLNGAMLVVRKDLNINKINELAGHTIAVPQFGNTQHLCLLTLLSDNGLSTIEEGGNVKVVESSNPDTKMLMDKGDIDAALVPEPWATQLTNEIGVDILLGSSDIWGGSEYSTAVIIVRTEFYEKNKELVERFLQAHIDITEYINENPEETMVKINDTIEKLTGSKLSEDVLESSFSNMIVTFNPGISSINKFMTIYREAGFVKNIPDINEVYDFEILNGILKDKNIDEIIVEP